MGIMTSIFDKIASVFNRFGASFPSLSLDNSKLGESLNLLKSYWELADSFLPMHEIITVFTIIIIFSIAMFTFWLVSRLINLIRGSG